MTQYLVFFFDTFPLPIFIESTVCFLKNAEKLKNWGAPIKPTEPFNCKRKVSYFPF